jgi:hypothetical protein
MFGELCEIGCEAIEPLGERELRRISSDFALAEPLPVTIENPTHAPPLSSTGYGTPTPSATTSFFAATECHHVFENTRGSGLGWGLHRKAHCCIAKN